MDDLGGDLYGNPRSSQNERATICWLVVWLPFLFSHILGKIIPIDFHIFQRASNHQPDLLHADHTFSCYSKPENGLRCTENLRHAETTPISLGGILPVLVVPRKHIQKSSVQNPIQKLRMFHMRVSINGGTGRWMVYTEKIPYKCMS